MVLKCLMFTLRRVGLSLSMKPPAKGDGVKDVAQRNKALKMADKAQKRRNRLAKAGEGDRTIHTKMPKHLFSGKRGIGKTDRR
jgi:nucleolar GTP-binding protein